MKKLRSQPRQSEAIEMLTAIDEFFSVAATLKVIETIH
jgi:hypothetical protein